MTESIAALAAALAKVQAELPTLERDRTVTVETKKGDEYTYSYVTLARLSSAILPLLAKHGLSFTAMPGIGSDGKMAVTYRLMHDSGESLSGEFPVSGEGGIQMIGGRISYIRRYCLAAVVGVAADEDDESRLDDAPRPARRAAQQPRGGGSAPPRQEGTTAARRSAPPAARPPLPGEGAQPPGEPITPPQLAKLHAMFNAIGWRDRADMLRASSVIVGRPLGSSKEMTKAEARGLIDRLEEVEKHAEPAERLGELLAELRHQEPGSGGGQ